MRQKVRYGQTKHFLAEGFAVSIVPLVKMEENVIHKLAITHCDEAKSAMSLLETLSKKYVGKPYLEWKENA